MKQGAHVNAVNNQEKKKIKKETLAITSPSPFCSPSWETPLLR
jgi:hypothetical protein